MELFKKKSETPESVKQKLGILQGKARKKTLGQVRQAVRAAYDAKRIVFWIREGKVEYTDKSGEKETMTPEELAAFFWTKFNNELLLFNRDANLGTLEISTEDILQIIWETIR